jgi:hypothetical protein
MSTVRLTHKFQGVELDVPEGTDYLAFFDREYPKWVAAVEKVVSNTAIAQTVTNTVNKVFDAPKPQLKNAQHCHCGAEKIFNPKTGKYFCKDKCWLKGQ